MRGTALSHLAMRPEDSLGWFHADGTPYETHPFDIATDYWLEAHMAISNRSVLQTGWKRQVHRIIDPRKQAVPEHLCVVNRFIHPMQVAQIGAKIARKLGLNAGLADAQCRFHDVGHLGKGHMAEDFLRALGYEFKHEFFGVTALLELDRVPLRHEVLLGVTHHSMDSKVMASENFPLENKATTLADKICYVTQDALDLLLILPHVPDRHFFPGYGRVKRRKLLQELEGLLAAYCPTFLLWYRNYPDKLTWNMLHYGVDQVVAESLEQGTVSFSRSKAAKNFWAIKKWLGPVYLDTDQETDKREMETVMAYLLERCGEYDPCLLFVLLDDLQIRDIAEALAAGKRHEASEVLYDLIHEDYSGLPKGPFDICQLPYFMRPGWSPPSR